MKQLWIVLAFAVQAMCCGSTWAFDINGPLGPGGGGILEDGGTNPGITDDCQCSYLMVYLSPFCQDLNDGCTITGKVIGITYGGYCAVQMTLRTYPTNVLQFVANAMVDGTNTEYLIDYLSVTGSCSVGIIETNFVVRGLTTTPEGQFSGLIAELYKCGALCGVYTQKLDVVQLQGITVSPQAAQVNEDVIFTAQMSPPGSGGSILSWSGGGQPATGTGTVFTNRWSTPGTYTVTVSCGINSECAGTTSVNVPVLKVDLDCDINNDGDITDDDEAGEETELGEIVFVDDEIDPSSGEDDLQLLKLTFEPADIGQGVAWFTYDSDKVQLYRDDTEADASKINPGTESSPNWDLEASATIPEEVYVKGKESTAEGSSIEIVFHWKKGSTEITDTILTTVTDEVGHYAYFRGIRDHLDESESRVFEDKVFVGGGFASDADFWLVAVRAEKSTMTVVDAKAEGLATIYEVLTAKAGNHIMVNGTFYEEENLIPFTYGPQTYGRVIEGGSELAVSGATIYPIAYRGWFGQNNDASFTWTRGSEPTPGAPLNSAVGGLAAFIPGNYAPSYLTIVNAINSDNPSQFTSALSHLGLADDNDENILFILYINHNHPVGQAFPAAVDRAGDLFPKLKDSGTSVLFGLDGGGSIGVAHEDLNGTVGVRSRGPRHDYGAATPGKVNNYILFQVAD